MPTSECWGRSCLGGWRCGEACLQALRCRTAPVNEESYKYGELNRVFVFGRRTMCSPGQPSQPIPVQARRMMSTGRIAGPDVLQAVRRSREMRNKELEVADRRQPGPIVSTSESGCSRIRPSTTSFRAHTLTSVQAKRKAYRKLHSQV